ncbi:hypothetical protein ACQP1W_32405 [Spirillospora sp. CA-255316]
MKAVWAQIAEATEAGRLGWAAKVDNQPPRPGRGVLIWMCTARSGGRGEHGLLARCLLVFQGPPEVGGLERGYGVGVVEGIQGESPALARFPQQGRHVGGRLGPLGRSKTA